MEEKLYTQSELDKAALEARIDESKKIRTNYAASKSYLWKALTRRITRYKSQLQELDK